MTTRTSPHLPCSRCRAGIGTSVNCWDSVFHSLLGCAYPSQHSWDHSVQDPTECEIYLISSTSLSRQWAKELPSPAAVFRPAPHRKALKAP